MKYKVSVLIILLTAFVFASSLVKALGPQQRPANGLQPPPDGGYSGNNTAEGTNPLFNLTTGTDNTALGYQTLYNTDTVGYNTAVGSQALFNNKSGTSDAFGDPPPGQQNTAVGYQALYNNTSGPADQFGSTGGEQNTGIGYQALFANTTGWPNTALGFQPLFSNTIGEDNVGIGYQSLFNNTLGSGNVALGDFAMHSNTVGVSNTAIGVNSLFSLNCTGSNCNDIGSANTAVGVRALQDLTVGAGNTAIGHGALRHQTTGHQNVAIGLRAGQDLTNGQGNIYIDSPGVSSENNTVRIGNTFFWHDYLGYGHAAHTATYIGGIYGQATSDAGSTTPVIIDANGKLGTAASSERFKHDIKSMDKTSESLLSLKPVTFHYKSDSKNTPQFGLVAEEVAKVNPNLVVRDSQGEIYTVRYDAVNAMLLNEFLKEHQRVQQLEATADDQKKEIADLKSELRKQSEAIQAVNDRIEINRAASQTVAVGH